jgi:methionyl-tRNA formyltransferase
MYLNKINLILSNSKRSFAYLNALKKNRLRLNTLFLYGFRKKIDKTKLPKLNKIYIYKNKKINIQIVKSILNTREKIFFISPGKGEIIKHRNFLNKLKILHLHPGKLPDFKGSTILYYSKLMKKNYHCTCFRLRSKIDNGEIYYQKQFKNLKINEVNYDEIDNEIRSQTLIELIKQKKLILQNNSKKSILKNYYIIHPLLRKLATNMKFKNRLKQIIQIN